MTNNNHKFTKKPEHNRPAHHAAKANDNYKSGKGASANNTSVNSKSTSGKSANTASVNSKSTSGKSANTAYANNKPTSGKSANNTSAYSKSTSGKSVNTASAYSKSTSGKSVNTASASNKSANSKTQKKMSHKNPRVTDRHTAEEVHTGDRIVVTIKRLGINGEGVGYYRRKAVFIEGALPNEVIKAQVTRVENKFIAAEMKQIEKRSPYRVDAPCPVFGICGGCQIQHMSYEGQLAAKEDILREAFSRYSGIEDVRMKPILGMEHPWGYRNKAQLQLGMQQEGIIAGLYAADSHKLIDITGCPIQHPKINDAVDKTRNVLQQLQIPIYKDKSGHGFVRTIVARWGFQSEQLQITLITTSDKLPRREELIQELRSVIPELTSIALNVNPKNTSLIFGNKTVVLWGADSIQESLGDLEFTLSPRAFFQLNPLQTVKLYESVRMAAGLTGRETVVDAYCGTGTIGLWLAPYAGQVRGIESIPEAVEDAQANAGRNGRANATFYEGYAEELLPRWVKSGFSPDVIIADPPRTGLDPRFIEAVLRTKPKRFVYVSCNPSTLAKDCKSLLDGGYSIEWVQPVDMFPQTSHVECTVLLKLKGQE